MKKIRRSKELKSLEIFKKGFRKNEIVIYAIALMLVTAGYFNYSANLDRNTVATYSDEVTKIENTQNTEIANTSSEQDKDEDIGDAKLVNSNDIVKETKDSEKKEDNKKEQKEKIEEKIEEKDNTDYFIATKLERDTNYADMVSTYKKILEDNSISETQKSIAMKEITKINETKNAISICENLLSTKGFENYVILVNDNSVNVVVKASGGLEKKKVAQIQNIISRELDSKIENIHITEK